MKSLVMDQSNLRIGSLVRNANAEPVAVATYDKTVARRG